MSGGNQIGQISGQAMGDANNLGNLSIDAMANRYMQLGLGGVGATPGDTRGRVAGIPGSGTTSTTPGEFSTGTTSATPGTGGTLPNLAGSVFGGTPPGVATPGSTTPPNTVPGVGFQTAGNPGGTTTPGTTPGATGLPTGGPTAFEMDAGVQPSWTGGIPAEFQGALGEAQFQDLGQTTSAAVGSQQAKTSLLSGVGKAVGGI